MREDSPSNGFAIRPRNKFFEANRSIVEHEIRSGRTVSFMAEVDLSSVERLRTKMSGPGKPSYTALVVKAAALAVDGFPYANRRVCRSGPWPFAGRRLQQFTHSDIAVAVERDIPGAEATAFLDILRDADTSSLDEITASLRALATADVATNRQWREFSGLITRLPSWLSAQLIRLPLRSPRHWVQYRGGAVLISSPSKYGVDAVLGSWPHPIGISFGLVKPRAVVVDGTIVARPTFFLSMNFDRRVMAGAQAARFFKRIVDLLEKAEDEFAPFHVAAEAPETRDDFPTFEADIEEPAFSN